MSAAQSRSAVLQGRWPGGTRWKGMSTLPRSSSAPYGRSLVERVPLGGLQLVGVEGKKEKTVS